MPRDAPVIKTTLRISWSFRSSGAAADTGSCAETAREGEHPVDRVHEDRLAWKWIHRMPSGEAPERRKVQTGPAVEEKTGPPEGVATSERWNPHHGVAVPAKGKYLRRTFVWHEARLRPHCAGLTERSVGHCVGVVQKQKPFARPDWFHHPKAGPDLFPNSHPCGIHRFPAARLHRESPPLLRIVVSRNQDHIECGVAVTPPDPWIARLAPSECVMAEISKDHELPCRSERKESVEALEIIRS
jgi:hypothetical protein